MAKTNKIMTISELVHKAYKKAGVLPKEPVDQLKEMLDKLK